MKRITTFLIILAIAFSLSLLGFFVDGDERNPDVMTNVFEVLMMTGLLATIISILYFGGKALWNRLRKSS